MVQRAPVEAGQGEDAVLLQSQGCFLPPRSSHWQIGELSLSARCFAFNQGGRPRFELPLARITAVAVERRKFILLRKEVIRLSYALADEERNRQAWFITPDLARWLEKLMTITNTREGLGRPADACGRSSRSSSALPRPMSAQAGTGRRCASGRTRCGNWRRPSARRLLACYGIYGSDATPASRSWPIWSISPRTWTCSPCSARG
jgi:hypothetical protein